MGQLDKLPIGVGDGLDVVQKILWHKTMQVSVNKHDQLDISALARAQPVKVSRASA